MATQKLTTLIVSMVIALVVGPAWCSEAQTVQKTVELFPGGHTIGGPGAFQGPAGSNRLLFGGAILPICATVANVGQVLVEVILDGGNSVAPGETITVCAQLAPSVTVECFGGQGTCKYMWRVDRTN